MDLPLVSISPTALRFNTFPQVYAQLNDVDFRTQATELNVPVYFIHGRWDYDYIKPAC